MSKTKNGSLFFQQAVVLLFFTIVGFVVYANSFKGVFVFDDWVDIVDNVHIHSLQNWLNIVKAYPTRLLVYLTFAVNYYLHGTDLFGYHLVNLCFHILATFVCYLIASVLFDMQNDAGGQRQKKEVFAFGCALIFMVHPLQTHAVTYIVQRLALMMSFFYLTGMYAYVRIRLRQVSRAEGQQNVGWVILFIVSILGGLFSKENFFSFPVMLLVIEYCFFDLWANVKKKFYNKRAMILIFSSAFVWACIGFIWSYFYLASDAVNRFFIVRFYDTGEYVNSYTYFLTQFRVIITYIRLFFFPVNQNADYAYAVSHSFSEHYTWVYALVIGLVVSGSFLVKKRFPLITFGILFFFVGLSVESSFFPTLNLINEYRMYLPLFGLLIAIFGFAIAVVPAEKMHILKALILVVFLLLYILTSNRNMVYSSEVIFWSDVIDKAPTKARAFNGRGVAYMREGKEDLAARDFKRALQLRPGYQTALFNLGKFAMAKQDYVKALEYFDAAARAEHIEIPPAHVAMTIGIVYLKQQKSGAAETFFDRALEVDPDLYFAHYYKALINAQQKDYQRAIDRMNSVLSHIRNFEYVNLRGIYYFNAQQYENALTDFYDALAMNPDDSAIYCNISDVYLKRNEYEKAFDFINTAIRIDPDLAEAYYKRAQIWRLNGQKELAEKDEQTAISLGG
jgi:protein O-mannosyl-transferase